jgi:hypothetical protein
MRIAAPLLIGALISAATGTAAQTAADSLAIRDAALDYIEGWYEGNAERMARALHPDLAKRIVQPRPDGAQLRGMTADQLVEATRRGGGRMTPADKQRKEVTILDVYGNAASVRVMAADWIDYLHIGKSDDRWVIINVLWELTPEAKARM